MTASSGAPRERFGVIVPSVNTVIEREFSQLPDLGASFHFTRVPAERSSDLGILRDMGAQAPAAAKMLAHVRPTRTVFACTSGSFIDGVEHHDAVAHAMQEASDTPATTTLHCVLAALSALGVQRPALATPYFGWVTDLEAECLEAYGFVVQSRGSLGIADGLAIAALDASSVIALARRTMTPEADSLFLSCTNLPSFGVLRQLEAELGVPVVSSNSATLWGLVGPQPGLNELGRLFE